MDSTVPLQPREYLFALGQLTETALPVASPPRGKDAKGQLIVFVDVDPAADERASERLRSRLVALYYKDPAGSLTSTLRRSIQKLNEEMYRENQSSVRSERRFASVACAVVRGDDLYLALVGDTSGYIGVKQRIEHVGRAELPSGERQSALLGQNEDVGVEMFHRDASGLQLLVLASSNAVDLSDERLDHSLLTRTDNVAALIRALAPRHTGPWPFRSLVVSADAPGATTGAPAAPPEPPLRRVARAVAADKPRSPAVSAPIVRRDFQLLSSPSDTRRRGPASARPTLKRTRASGLTSSAATQRARA